MPVMIADVRFALFLREARRFARQSVGIVFVCLMENATIAIVNTVSYVIELEPVWHHGIGDRLSSPLVVANTTCNWYNCAACTAEQGTPVCDNSWSGSCRCQK